LESDPNYSHWNEVPALAAYCDSRKLVGDRIFGDQLSNCPTFWNSGLRVSIDPNVVVLVFLMNSCLSNEVAYQ